MNKIFYDVMRYPAAAILPHEGEGRERGITKYWVHNRSANRKIEYPLFIGNLGPAINGPDGAYAPFISPDGSYLIFTRNLNEGWTRFINFWRRDGTWTPPADLRGTIKGIEGTNVGEPFVTRDGRYLMFFGERDETAAPFWVDASFTGAFVKKY